MPSLLMNLRHVPEDEIDEVRALLERHGFDYYQTEPNRWGISAGGIWLRDEQRLEEARALLRDYQHERQARARAEQERLRREGRVETLLDRVRARPLQTLIYLAVVALLLYLSTKPFLDLG